LSPVGDLASTVESASAAYFGITVAPHEYFHQTPTALDAILARAGAETLQSIAIATKGEPKEVMEELARRHLIRPVATQGHIGDVLPDKIVYDAQTTSGGSGGPFFNNAGKVIGINFVMVGEFSGSNFAIPVG
jgi:hypothetical protein